VQLKIFKSIVQSSFLSASRCSS